MWYIKTQTKSLNTSATMAKNIGQMSMKTITDVQNARARGGGAQWTVNICDSEHQNPINKDSIRGIHNTSNKISKYISKYGHKYYTTIHENNNRQHL